MKPITLIGGIVPDLITPLSMPRMKVAPGLLSLAALLLITSDSKALESSQAWSPIDTFEEENAIDHWTLAEANNQTTEEHPQITVILEDEDGNHYLSRQSARLGLAGNRNAQAYRKLPFEIPVGAIATLYARFKLEAPLAIAPTNQNFGLSNLLPGEIEIAKYNALEAQLRVTDKDSADGNLQIHDDDDPAYGNVPIINPATGEAAEVLEGDVWYETWSVIDNGLRADGGQYITDFYVRGGSEFPEQTQVYSDALFRIQRELPLGYFLAIANGGPESNPYGNAPLHYDDLYLRIGEHLSVPEALEAGPEPARIVNLSTRGLVQEDAKAMIAGFVISGTESMQVLIDVKGPGLEEYGIDDYLQDPQLSLRNSSGVEIAFNDDHAIDWASFEDAPGFGPENELDAGIIATLEPGIYTVIASPASGSAPGIGIVEIVDLASVLRGGDNDSRLVNISARAEVGIGDEQLIAGFITMGNQSDNYLVRSLGLEIEGLASLADPKMSIFQGGKRVARSDQYANEGNLPAITQASLNFDALLLDETDAALIMPLNPASSDTTTIHVSGAEGSVGLAIVEIFEMARE